MHTSILELYWIILLLIFLYRIVFKLNSYTNIGTMISAISHSYVGYFCVYELLFITLVSYPFLGYLCCCLANSDLIQPLVAHLVEFL